MNNHQRGVYQPVMENVPIYDLSDDDVEEERSRLPLLIVIALVVLAAFAGVVWLAYNQGVARGRSGGEIVISAPDGPVRTAPGDVEASTPYTGLKVYGEPLPPDQEAQSSSLAQNAVPGMPLEILRQAEPETPVEAPPVRLNPEAPPAAAQTAPAAQAPAPAAKPAPVPPAPAPAKTAAAPAAGGGALLQIGAYPSEDLANGAWAAFRARHADVAGALSPDIQKADLGAKGIWYRLRAGPFADRTAANAACAKLKAAGTTCFLASP
jgi:cell division septation protein DedD